MPKNFIVTDFHKGGNYVRCPHQEEIVKIKEACHKCKYFKGGGRLEISKQIFGNHFIYCLYLITDYIPNERLSLAKGLDEKLNFTEQEKERA